MIKIIEKRFPVYIIALPTQKDATYTAHLDICNYIIKLEKENKRIIKENERYIEQTKLIDEHSEDFDLPCECKLCQSYMVSDMI